MFVRIFAEVSGGVRKQWLARALDDFIYLSHNLNMSYNVLTADLLFLCDS